MKKPSCHCRKMEGTVTKDTTHAWGRKVFLPIRIATKYFAHCVPDTLHLLYLICKIPPRQIYFVFILQMAEREINEMSKGTWLLNKGAGIRTTSMMLHGCIIIPCCSLNILKTVHVSYKQKMHFPNRNDQDYTISKEKSELTTIYTK